MVTLPGDVIAIIIWQMREYAGYQSFDEVRYKIPNGQLAKLMRVNRSFYHIVRPILYHTLDVHANNITAILRACFARPDTFNLVRKIFLEQPFDMEYPQSPSEISLYSSAASTLAIPPALRDLLTRGLSKNLPDALTVLLMCSSQALRKFDFTIYDDDDDDDEHGFGDGRGEGEERSLLRSIVEFSPSSFRNLREIHLRYGDTEMALNFSGQTHWLELPSLVVFRATQTDFTSQLSASPAPVPFPSSSLREIDLIQSLIDLPNLKAFLSSCQPTLRSLSVDWGSATVGYLDDAIDFGDLGDILREHASELRVLRLRTEDLTDGYVPPDLDLEAVKNLGSLRGMKGLKELRVSWELLFCHPYVEKYFRDPGYLVETALPEGLEKLEIWGLPRAPGNVTAEPFAGAVGCIDRQIQRLMESEKFGELREIVVGRKAEYTLRPPEGWRAESEDLELSGWRVVRLKRVGRE